jgi:CrcB protein
VPLARDPFALRGRSRWPRLAPNALALVFAGGCAGGLARYGLTTAWRSADDQLPCSVLAVNSVGAFALALLLPYAFAAPHHRWLRPLLATGFLGAFTTFAAVVTTADRLAGNGRPGVAAAYVGATLLAGLLAALLGHALGRRLLRRR